MEIKYKTGNIIGEGNEGIVYGVIDEPNKVIKILHTNNKKNTDILTDFYNETFISSIAGDILPQISPKIYSFGITSSSNGILRFIVMDKIKGDTMKSIEQYEKYKNTLVDKYMILRDNGIYIKDIVGGNIMIGKIGNSLNEDVFIIDFGGDSEYYNTVTNREKYKKHILKSLEDAKTQLEGYVNPSLVKVSNPMLSVSEQRERAKLRHINEEKRKQFKNLKETFKKNITGQENKSKILKRYTRRINKINKINRTNSLELIKQPKKILEKFSL